MTKAQWLVILPILLISLLATFWVQSKVNTFMSIPYTKDKVNVLIEGEFTLQNLVLEEDIYIAQNNDPQIIIPLQNQELEAVEIIFAEPVNQSMPITIYYATPNNGYSEEYTVRKTIKLGEYYTLLELPKLSYTSLRIDIGTEEGISYRVNSINVIENYQIGFNSLVFVTIVFVLYMLNENYCRDFLNAQSNKGLYVIVGGVTVIVGSLYFIKIGLVIVCLLGILELLYIKDILFDRNRKGELQ